MTQIKPNQISLHLWSADCERSLRQTQSSPRRPGTQKLSLGARAEGTEKARALDEPTEATNPHAHPPLPSVGNKGANPPDMLPATLTLPARARIRTGMDPWVPRMYIQGFRRREGSLGKKARQASVPGYTVGQCPTRRKDSGELLPASGPLPVLFLGARNAVHASPPRLPKAASGVRHMAP